MTKLSEQDVEGHLMTPLRRRRSWLAVAMVLVAVFGVACSSGGSAPAAAKVIETRARRSPICWSLSSPPRLPTAPSVSPWTRRSRSASPTACWPRSRLVNDNGKPIAGQLSPDGLRWPTTEQLGYNRRYTLNVQGHGLGGAATRQMTFQTSSPAAPDDALRGAQRRRGRGYRRAGGDPVRREHRRPRRGREGHQDHRQPARRGRFLLAEQPRSALAPRALLEAGHGRRRRGQHLRRRPG